MGPDEEREYREFVVARTDSLRRFAYLLCGDWHLAEDAVQIALTRLYVVWPRLHRRGEVDAYARRTVLRATIDERRRAWFRRERVSDQLPDPALIDDNTMTAERLVVLEALSRMPGKQRAAIVLRYWEDLTVEETAATRLPARHGQEPDRSRPRRAAPCSKPPPRQ